ncbi:sigma-70 family RNA polymerase sigma factor [bacterium]|nr:sigma-70 family RNA polymerase sigma factor [bacterium]
MQNNSRIREYMDIVQKVAKVEQRRIPMHMVEYEELLSIGIIAVQAMIEGKNDTDLERYNAAYIGTAVRWAIRNELRNRYKWYSLKHKKDEESENDSNIGDDLDYENSDDDGIEVTPSKVREAVYETILSIDSIAAANSDNDSPFDFVKDTKAMPDEAAEITEMSRMIKEAIAQLPQKDRTIVEYRFYRNMQVKEIAQHVGLSSSRITRIIQAALNSVREYLTEHDQQEY